VKSAISKLEAERAEVDDILSSGVFGRNNNPLRLLTFVCEKYFEGATDEIKEYSIAVQALGRPGSFDPQVDTIVRVTAHALRKKLEDYYTNAGAERAVHICLPPGHYVPKFIHTSNLTADSGVKFDVRQDIQSVDEVSYKGNGQSDHDHVNPAEPRQDSKADKVTKPGEGGASRLGFSAWTRMVFAVAILVISVFAGSDYAWKKSKARSHQNIAQPGLAAATSGYSSATILRFMDGEASVPYTDHAGAIWHPDQSCSGGSTFSVAGHTIQGTEDGPLFSNGRRGVFHCKYRVPPGTYEVHLLFAETSGLQENSRNVGFSINGGTAYNLDVVDDAGGDDIATTKVLTDVAPSNDGTIHLDFNTPDAFVNAIEILPAVPHRMLPVRIVVGHSPYRDSSGNVWISDRYYFGGRLSSFGGDLSGVTDGGLYAWHRFGHFHYVVPVVPDGKYTVRLYFMEHWFGVQNGGIGGVGSRIFDVYCNGSTLLKGFDIFREAGSQPLVKSFRHIEPTAQGKIEINFTPAVNYPSVSAIEVLQE
jgi:malectin (di-glucose binding ER protein)